MITGALDRRASGAGRGSATTEPVSDQSLEQELLDVAREAAHASAAELLPRFGDGHRRVRSKSTPTDLVSDADIAAEKAIRAILASRRPGDAILGEEGGETGSGALRWVIDPLDGTVNYLFGVPQFGISVACEDSDGAVVGIVLDPIRDECFAATRSGAPTVNGAPIEPSGRDELATALVATGFGYDSGVRAGQAEVLRRVLPRVRDIRRAGAAALDLVWCACGRYDAFYERGIKRWDYAAGGLIAARAGLEVLPLEPLDGQPSGLVVAPRAFADELFRLVVDG